MDVGQQPFRSQAYAAEVIRQAILLLGGRGTRLWPLTDRRPKGLLPVVGLPFFEYQVRLLEDVGAEDIILAVGSADAPAWSRYLEGRSDLKHVRLEVEQSPLDTAGPVRAIFDQLDDRFLVLNGDVLFDADLADISLQAGAEAVIALTPVDDPSAFGVVVSDEARRVTAFVEKPPLSQAPSKEISAGIYMLTPDAVARYPEGPLSFERAVFPDLAGAGSLFSHVVHGSWLDIGRPELYLEAHSLVSSGTCRVFRPSPSEQTGPGSDEGSSARSWLGEGAVVEQGASIEDSVLLPGAVVRRGASVRRSIVGWSAEVGANASVEELSVIGEGAHVGEGNELAGVRVAPGASLTERAITVRPPQ